MTEISGHMVKALKATVNRFDSASHEQKRQLLARLSENKLPLNKTLISYFEVLLFICAFPPDKKILAKAEQQLLRITSFLKNFKKNNTALFTNSGMPFTAYVSRFSYDCVQWLMNHPDCKTSINQFEDGIFELNDVLKITLPALEKSETTAGLDNVALLETLSVKKENQLYFLIKEIGKLDKRPGVTDHFFDGLGIQIETIPKNKLFSRVNNRLPNPKVFFHREILRKFDYVHLFNKKIAAPVNLSATQKEKNILVVKNAMALKDRETDPVTYMDENTFRFYELDRGIAVAIYGMLPQRQMPLESYVGYTLFKNGFPAVYGGGWVFGRRSDFGINIFETFRGGESGYMMCQLLRVFRQVFQIDYFEIEPYQFGLDNPEGIESGAFWFYYRYGFRPLEKKLLKIANGEFAKTAGYKHYRTPEKTLIKFTQSNMVFNLGKKIPVGVYDISNKVIRMIRVQYHGDRGKAEAECVIKFTEKTGLNTSLNEHETHVLKEVAMWAEALKINERKKLDLFIQMVKIKPADLYGYQQLLLQFFNE
ncbi:MAG: hypothetical protein ABI666_06050 [Ferruginibacter sp.]